MLAFFEEAKISNKELFYTPKTGNKNFLGHFIITAIISAIGIVIIKRSNKEDR